MVNKKAMRAAKSKKTTTRSTPPKLRRNVASKSSFNSKSTKKIIPVYERQPEEKDPTESKNGTDLYEFEFDSDSEPLKKKKRKKRQKVQRCTGAEYKAKIDSIVKKIAQNIAIKRAATGLLTEGQLNCGKNKIVLGPVCSTVKAVGTAGPSHSTVSKKAGAKPKPTLKKSKTTGGLQTRIENKAITRAQLSKKVPEKPASPIKNFDAILNCNENTVTPISKVHIISDILVSPGKVGTADPSHSTVSKNVGRNPKPTLEKSKTTGGVQTRIENKARAQLSKGVFEKPASPLEKFDDNFNCNENTMTPISKVHINSDISVSPRKVTIFNPITPHANISSVFNPWRFNEINIKRNPHFITLKESALPSLSQDMVLDHRVVDRFDESASQSQRIEENSKTTVQKTLDDYFDIPFEDKENIHVTNLSLFDSDALSPIKHKPKKEKDKPEAVKRKILGESTQSNIISQGASKSTPVHHDLPIESWCFGFDSDDEQARSSETHEAIICENERPFRLPLNMNDKKYYRKIKETHGIESPSIEQCEDGNLTDPEDNEVHEEVRLFEDCSEDEQDAEDARKLKRTKVPKWLKFEKDVLKKKKGKDMRTKEEEAAYEKWAADLNSTFDDIENFALEIE